MLNNVKAVMTTMSKQGFQLFLASFLLKKGRRPCDDIQVLN